MRFHWPQLLLLATFAYWATGTAKLVHELTEHHGGRTACVVDGDGDGDDDCAGGSDLRAEATCVADHCSGPQKQPASHGHPCPVCQMLAAMILDQTPSHLVLVLSRDPIADAPVRDHVAPVVGATFSRLSTGPPGCPSLV